MVAMEKLADASYPIRLSLNYSARTYLDLDRDIPPKDLQLWLQRNVVLEQIDPWGLNANAQNLSNCSLQRNIENHLSLSYFITVMHSVGQSFKIPLK